ncbi:hypothetical protein [Tateyamaria sp.]|uniref:hypothetical protein n=1 Tax=Tateyamaria sp. TaxID=1929288 RepID=UPI00329D2E9D
MFTNIRSTKNRIIAAVCAFVLATDASAKGSKVCDVHPTPALLDQLVNQMEASPFSDMMASELEKQGLTLEAMFTTRLVHLGDTILIQQRDDNGIWTTNEGPFTCVREKGLPEELSALQCSSEREPYKTADLTIGPIETIISVDYRLGVMASATINWGDPDPPIFPKSQILILVIANCRDI